MVDLVGLSGVPTIPKIQELIESAWEKGFDPSSRDVHGGKLVGTKKTIGPVEGWVLFRSLRIPVVLVDVFSPQAAWHWAVDYYRSRYGIPEVSAESVKDVTSTAPQYNDLKEDLFISSLYHLPPPTSYIPPLADPSDPAAKDKPSPYNEKEVFDLTSHSSPFTAVPAAKYEVESEGAKKEVVFCPPVYLQFVGRSKTLIGIEPLEKGVFNLLCFDPYSPFQADPKEDPFKIINSMRHPPSRIAGLNNVFEFLFIEKPEILDENDMKEVKDLEELAAAGSPVFQRIF